MEGEREMKVKCVREVGGEREKVKEEREKDKTKSILVNNYVDNRWSESSHLIIACDISSTLVGSTLAIVEGSESNST